MSSGEPETGAAEPDTGRRQGRDGLTAGAACNDVTPELGRGMIGYVRPDMRSNGVHSRLYARALVLEAGGRKLALVSADMLYGIQKDAVVDRIRDLGFSRENVVYSGTHTHAAPDASDWMVERVADAVRRADESREPAVAAWGEASVSGVSRNRSVEAHLANHGEDLARGEGDPDMDPRGAEHTVDRSVRLLRVEAEDGRPIAAWTRFSVHPTCFPPDNRMYSADLAGAAAHHFRTHLEGRELPAKDSNGRRRPVVLFSNGGEGDQIPRYDGFNRHAVADRLGRKLSGGYLEAWDDAGNRLSSNLALESAGRHVEYRGQEVEDGKRVASRPTFGVPFLGGAENGPSFFHGLGLEGRRRPAALAGEVHGRKIPVAPAHWGPDVEVQVARVGDVALLAVPGEPTVEMARRCREEALEALPDQIDDATVLGVTNGYNGYFTTPEEYDQQHYEGGHTVFGKHSEALVRKTHVELSRSMAYDGGANQDVTDASKRKSFRRENEEFADPPVESGSRGELSSQPPKEVERGSVVGFAWNGGGKGRDRQVDEPFVVFERSEGDGWTSVVSDLNLGLVWSCRRGRYRARYELPLDIEPGVYRFRVDAAGYSLTTDEIEVSACTELSLQGVDTRSDGTRFVFQAQNPPPEPGTALRSREVTPTGGEVEFEVGGEPHSAAFDPYRDAWVADVEDVDEFDEKDVLEDCRLVDGEGNSSGDPVDLGVGVVKEVEWPSGMEVGGGKPPGPFGFGTWPI